MTTLKLRNVRSATRAIRPIGIAVALFALLLPWVVDLPGLSEVGSRMFGIFLMAIVLWVTEAIPLHATATLIVLLEILLVSDQAFGVEAIGDPPPFSTFFAAFAHPVIMLFLGGFFIAEGAAKFGFDRYLAKVMLRPFGTSTRFIMLGLMVITAGLSMFMSNTATTATLMAVIIPVIAGLPAGDRLKTGLALSIPIAANIGGMGTPVGTPPNAIAVGSLGDSGYSVSFLQWMIVSVPIVLLLLFGAWWLLGRFYRSSSDRIDINIEASFDRSMPAMVFYATFAVTVVLWLTEPIHGVSSSIVGFLPVVVLLSTRVFTTRDMQSIQWNVLWLVAGGIALGIGVGTSGLDDWLVGRINWTSIDPGMVVVVLALIAVALSTVISNSAATNLLMPIGLSLAISGGLGLSPVLVAFFIAIAASSAMALPVSTPPNAIAYSTGAVTTKNMAIVGLAVGAVSLVLFFLIAPPIWSLLGVT
ncbi:MAG: DASS family sodium-coupled anion symporter [Acidimicrobiia bacterium]